MPVKPPHNEHELELALVRRAGKSNLRAATDRTTMANAIVARMLGEDVAVKGGASLRFRYSSGGARYTMDFDVTRKIGFGDFLAGFRARLAEGWCGFTGEADVLPQASPAGVPPEYVMQPVRVRLKYRNHSWCSVNLEVTAGEAGCADESDCVEPGAEAVAIFADLGFPPPDAVRLMPLEHQMAQKLRGAAGRHSRRAHDLIDLQLMMLHDGPRINLARVRDICRTIFRYSDTPPWPPEISMRPLWDTLYAEQVADLPVLSTVEEAIDWTNALIAQIDSSK